MFKFSTIISSENRKKNTDIVEKIYQVGIYFTLSREHIIYLKLLPRSTHRNDTAAVVVIYNII